MKNIELISAAASVLKPHMAKDRQFGDVGAAVLSESGNVYTGVSVDTPGWDCAPNAARWLR